MKHLFNELPNELKNTIREQYSGGMSIDTSKFKKLVESKLGDAKPLLNEGGSIDCLTSKGWKKETIGGPQTRRDVYKKTENGSTYEISSKGKDGLSTSVTISKDDTYKQCVNWSCDDSTLGISYSGCKNKIRTYDK